MKVVTTIALVACVFGTLMQGYRLFFTVNDILNGLGYRYPIVVISSSAIGLIQQVGLVAFFAVLRKNQK